MPTRASDKLAFRPMPGDPRPASTVRHRVNSPDLSAQLSAAATVTAVVCCALDTDPAAPLNAAVATASAADVVAGLLALAERVGGRPRVILAADPDGPAWDPLRAAVARPVRLLPLHGDYPQADPSLALFSLLRRRLPAGALPTAVNAVLIDAAAAADVVRPDGPVNVAVRDHFARRTHLLAVPAGTPLGDVLRFADVDPATAVLRAGDFLRDQLAAPDEPVTAAGERVFHASAAALPANPDPCVRCGWCVEACPTRVHPAGLLDAAQRADPALARRYGLAGCIECGICTYVCPTRLPLLASIRQLRAEQS